ncbi:MAG: heme a synthase [Verrucomicrobiota bacterium]|jgi:cytochrome c oxidase assembly protein subunit 15
MATLCLIWVGGLVTSHGAGMAVPDWPTSYGYNMFYFPISKWVGGIFYEHTHRLLAAGVGLLTSILAAWIWGRETRGRSRWAGWAAIVLLVGLLSHRGAGRAVDGGLGNVPVHFQVLAVVLPCLLAVGVVRIIRTGGSLRWLAMTAFFAVIFQGILGGFRVAWMQDALGIFHAALAQLFFVLLAAIALVTSKWWQDAGAKELPVYGAGKLRYFFPLMTGILFAQLVLGASMRHAGAGLAIPDFPTAYGKLWPAMDADSITRYNQHRTEVNATNPITAPQIAMQMAHRTLALGIFAGVAWVAGAVRSRWGARTVVSRLATAWFGIILLQVILGAATIWTHKAADIATLHVAVGALALCAGTILSLVTLRLCRTGSVPGYDERSAARVGAALEMRSADA